MKLAVLAAVGWSAAFMVGIHGPHRALDWAIAVGGGVLLGLIVLELCGPGTNGAGSLATPGSEDRGASRDHAC